MEVTRSLSKRNLYKSHWVVISGEEKCVIDSNARLAQRIEEHEILRKLRANAPVGYGDSEDGEAEFVSGLGGEEIDALIAGDGGENGIIKAGAQEDIPDLEEIQAQAQEMIDDARSQIEDMQRAAQQEIEMQRRQALEDANRTG